MDLTGKTVIVTGVSKGIGKALVELLLYKKAKVAGWGNTKPEIINEDFQHIKTDVRKYKEVENALQKTQDEFGEQVHVLVNNSGLGYFSFLEETSLEKWDEMFQVNVNGIFYCCRNVIPVMKKYKYGHIINVASIAGLEGMANASGYCGTKHAVRGITESLFRELRDFNIKVTGIYPGSVKTDFFRNAQGIKAHDNMMMPTDVAQQIVNAIETPDNFLVNAIEMRPLQPKPAGK
jgi:NADP-dependent 3-hydroxy acid dehydrogenase YdfG